MSTSFTLEAPDHFTAGTIGPPGQRVFYLQGREDRTVVTLKLEKEQVRALGDYLAGLLAQLPAATEAPPDDVALLEPIAEAWAAGSIAVGYDQTRDRVVVEVEELVDEEEEPKRDAATARFLITLAQGAAFVERSRDLMRAGRPVCPLCSQPKDSAGHVCPRSNGHALGQVPVEP